jgi:hypothetical protein
MDWYSSQARAGSPSTLHVIGPFFPHKRSAAERSCSVVMSNFPVHLLGDPAALDSGTALRRFFLPSPFVANAKPQSGPRLKLWVTQKCGLHKELPTPTGCTTAGFAVLNSGR